MPKILLHACCAVCASYPFLQLQKAGYEVILYFYNPNIYPNEEYQRRLNELKNLSKKYNARLIIEETGYDYWQNLIKGKENEPEKGTRCDICFKERLTKAQRKAFETGCDFYTTTLTVSPHKNSKQIFEAAKAVNKEMTDLDSKSVPFLEIDFKKQDGYKKTSKLADEYGFYRQKYCGCEYSIRN